MVEWRDVPGHGGNYQASSAGEIRSNHGILKPGTRSGYLLNVLCRDGGQKTYSAHRLVLESFVGPCPNGMEACHADGDRTNNRIENLRWDTRENNISDKKKYGMYSYKLSEIDVKFILHWLKSRYSQRVIADEFNINQSTVSDINTGRRWAWLT